jgi:endonuclease-8
VPEGDTVHRAARRLDSALTGRTITSVEGSHRTVRREGRRLTGREVSGVDARGKHLLVHVAGGWSIHTHLGMTGVWHVYGPDERWRRSPGKARLVIRTPEAVAVCFAAPTVEIAPTSHVTSGLDRLGPDLTVPGVDIGAAVRRTETSAAPTMADLLLDQEVASGIGNVYKSEILHLERIHPDTHPARLTAATLHAAYARAARLLQANVGHGGRTTTGRRGREATWVYGRSGEACRRCGVTIRSAAHGPLDRVTYWCPSCQPEPGTSSRNLANG